MVFLFLLHYRRVQRIIETVFFILISIKVISSNFANLCNLYSQLFVLLNYLEFSFFGKVFQPAIKSS